MADMSSRRWELSAALAFSLSILGPSAAYSQQLNEAVAKADSCVANYALRYARYTNETAAMVADYAARTCAKEISAAGTGTDSNTIFKIIANKYALKVVQWRTRIAVEGQAGYDALSDELLDLPGKEIIR